MPAATSPPGLTNNLVPAEVDAIRIGRALRASVNDPMRDPISHRPIPCISCIAASACTACGVCERDETARLDADEHYNELKRTGELDRRHDERGH